MFGRVIFPLLLLTLLLSGCHGLGKSQTDTVIQDGKLEGYVHSTVGNTADAARKAMLELKLTVTMYRVDPSSARVTALAPNGTRVAVDITPTEDDHSKVVVDTGESGTKAQVTEVYDGIRKYAH